MVTREELVAAGLDDFRVFLCIVWEYLGLPKPTKVQLDIAYNLQHAPRRFILQAFRGVGKSWITVAFVLWILLLDPQKKIMVVSASQQLADDFSKFCKQVIHGMPLLQHLAPGPGQRDSGISFDVGPATPSKDPSVKSVGITGQLTGSRADIIIGDDVEIPKNSYTQLLRDRLATLVKEFDAVLKPNGRVIYLGTPQIEASLYNLLAAEREYSLMIWPAEIPEDTTRYNGRLAPLILRLINAGLPVGAPVDPKRFDTEDLRERRASYGRAGYALQFMLDTSQFDADRNPLKLRDLIVHDVDGDMAHVKLVHGTAPELVITDLEAGGLIGDRYHRPAWKSPEMAKYTATVMAIDPSGRGADETGYAIVKYLHGMLYGVDIGGFRDGFAEATLQTLAAKAARWGVNDVIIEQNYGGGMFDQLLKPHLARLKAGTIDEEWKGWSSTQKEARICDTLEPVLSSHRLVLARHVIEADLPVLRETPKYSLVYQLTRMTRLKDALGHEDRLEALSMACGYFTEKMARDQDRSLEAHKEALKDQQLRDFMGHVFGRSPAPARWGQR